MGAPRVARRLRTFASDALPVTVLIVFLLLLWEAIKLVAGQATRYHIELFGLTLDGTWKPPLQIHIANDLNMPHIWSVVIALAEPAQRTGAPLWGVLASAAAYTMREAFLGFLIGSAVGVALAVVMSRVALVERAFLPYVVASQTIPIIAIAPMIVIAFQGGWASVALISAYLAFFPVTIGCLRGIQSVDPMMADLLRSYAASSSQKLIKLEFPSSLPYLFSGLRLAAAASFVGAIVAELPSGVADGLGHFILVFNQFYITGPERLWAAIVVTGIIGLVPFALVVVLEYAVLPRHHA